MLAGGRPGGAHAAAARASRVHHRAQSLPTPAPVARPRRPGCSSALIDWRAVDGEVAVTLLTELPTRSIEETISSTAAQELDHMSKKLDAGSARPAGQSGQRGRHRHRDPRSRAPRPTGTCRTSSHGRTRTGAGRRQIPPSHRRDAAQADPQSSRRGLTRSSPPVSRPHTRSWPRSARFASPAPPAACGPGGCAPSAPGPGRRWGVVRGLSGLRSLPTSGGSAGVAASATTRRLTTRSSTSDGMRRRARTMAGPAGPRGESSARPGPEQTPRSRINLWSNRDGRPLKDQDYHSPTRWRSRSAAR